MIAQRGHGVKANKKARGSKSGKPNAQNDTPAQKTKLSYKHKFALETLPKTMAALEAEIAGINEKLADPEYYIKDPDGFTLSIEQLDTAQTKMEKCEEEWLELELLREDASD